MEHGEGVAMNNCKIKRVRYDSSGGAMNFHSEFDLEASADEVIRASYWDDFFFDRVEENVLREKLLEIDSSYRTSADGGEMTVREHIPMDQELWNVLIEEMEYLQGQLVPIKDKPMWKSFGDVQVLDGGDYSRLYITWNDGGEEKTIQYYAPSGNRWSTVIQVFHEMVRPLGRNLRRIGKTQLTEMFLKTPGYSYQITPIRDDQDFYFFVHGDKSDTNKVSREQWMKAREYLGNLDLSAFGSGKYECRYYLKLCYNDGMNKNLEINKKTAEKIRAFLQSLTKGNR